MLMPAAARVRLQLPLADARDFSCADSAAATAHRHRHHREPRPRSSFEHLRSPAGKDTIIGHAPNSPGSPCAAGSAARPRSRRGRSSPSIAAPGRVVIASATCVDRDDRVPQGRAGGRSCRERAWRRARPAVDNTHAEPDAACFASCRRAPDPKAIIELLSSDPAFQTPAVRHRRSAGAARGAFGPDQRLRLAGHSGPGARHRDLLFDSGQHPAARHRSCRTRCRRSCIAKRRDHRSRDGRDGSRGRIRRRQPLHVPAVADRRLEAGDPVRREDRARRLHPDGGEGRHQRRFAQQRQTTRCIITVSQPAPDHGPNVIREGENLNPVKTLRMRYDAWRKNAAGAEFRLANENASAGGTNLRPSVSFWRGGDGVGVMRFVPDRVEPRIWRAFDAPQPRSAARSAPPAALSGCARWTRWPWRTRRRARRDSGDDADVERVPDGGPIPAEIHADRRRDVAAARGCNAPEGRRASVLIVHDVGRGSSGNGTATICCTGWVLEYSGDGDEACRSMCRSPRSCPDGTRGRSARPVRAVEGPARRRRGQRILPVFEALENSRKLDSALDVPAVGASPRHEALVAAIASRQWRGMCAERRYVGLSRVYGNSSARSSSRCHRIGRVRAAADRPPPPGSARSRAAARRSCSSTRSVSIAGCGIRRWRRCNHAFTIASATICADTPVGSAVGAISTSADLLSIARRARRALRRWSGPIRRGTRIRDRDCRSGIPG